VIAKLYYKAHSSSYWRLANGALAEIGIHRGFPSREEQRIRESVEQQITTVIKSRPRHRSENSRAALTCQPAEFLAAGSLLAAQFLSAFGTEAYIRVRDTTGSPTLEDDLFEGLVR
jgi:hypothetical protein